MTSPTETIHRAASAALLRSRPALVALGLSLRPGRDVPPGLLACRASLAYAEARRANDGPVAAAAASIFGALLPAPTLPLLDETAESPST